MPDAQIAKHGFRKPLFVERDGLNPATPDKKSKLCINAGVQSSQSTDADFCG
jgi:hypothetical protein